MFGTNQAPQPMRNPITGGCLCGAVRYECYEPPIAMLKCHCRDCQRASGGPHVCAVLLPSKSFFFTRGTPAYHTTQSEGGDFHRRGFCAECGSRLTGGEDPQSPKGFIGVTVGSLDDASWFRPDFEIWTCDALIWDPPSPGLPAFVKNPPSEDA